MSQMLLDVWVTSVAQMVKNLPQCRRLLGWEDPLEKGMATHSSILSWRIPWTEEPAGYNPWGHNESDTTEHVLQKTVNFFHGLGSGEWGMVWG